MSAAEQVTKVRSSAKPRLGVRRPVMVLCPMLVGLQSQKECIEDEPKQQRGELVTLLLSTLEVNRCRSPVG